MPRLVALDEVAQAVTAMPETYLRFSKGPLSDLAEGPSWDYESGVQLPGWSVVRIHPEEWWPRSAREWIARRIAQYAQLRDSERFAWLLTGPVVGYGPDHEPLLSDLQGLGVVADSAVTEALECYRSSFQVGRDSAR